MSFRAETCSLRCISHLRIPRSPSYHYLFQSQRRLSAKTLLARFTTSSFHFSDKASSGLVAQPQNLSLHGTKPFASLLNPPSTARPPPLELPIRSPSQSTFSYYYSLGKAYIKFYKDGIKAIYTNYKLCKPILNRFRHRLTPLEALKQGLLSRGEFFLVQRTSSDVRRIPLFALVYIFCGEFTPLVVVAVSGIVPRTLWIPKQVDTMRAKTDKRRVEARGAWGTIPSEYHQAVTLNPSEKQGVLKIGRILGLYPQWWDRLPFSPISTIRKRVARRLELLDVDDSVIARDGGVAGLEGEEVKMAAETRGLEVRGRAEKEVRDELDRWIRERKTRSVVELVRDGVSSKR